MVDVRYSCPRCGTVAVLDRDASLSDKSVTPYPLEGWSYAAPDGEYEDDDADGVRLVCGESSCTWAHVDGRTGETAEIEGCGDPFYLNFVKYEAGEEVDAEGERERVRRTRRGARPAWAVRAEWPRRAGEPLSSPSVTVGSIASADGGPSRVR